MSLLALVLAGCGTVNTHYDASKRHHCPDGFSNNYIDSWRDDQPSLWAWQWERLRGTLPPQDPSRVPVVAPQLEYLLVNRRDVTVTWIGHATSLWQLGGLNILTDPHFTQRASPVSFAGPKREVALPMALAQLPRIDVVLVSHNHYDHLDAKTIHMLNRQPGGPPLFVVPLGVDLWLKRAGVTRVQSLDWWDNLKVSGPLGEVTVHLVPVQHWSSRSPWDRNATLWGGFVAQAVVDGSPYSMLFVGDTGYSQDFADIGAKFGGFDFAQIPVGCYLPRWFMQDHHINEEEAVRIHLDVKSRLSMGVHWGTFRLCDDPIDAPMDGLPQARKKFAVNDDEFVLFAVGQTKVLKRAAP